MSAALDPRGLFLVDTNYAEVKLICPQCHMDYTHVERVWALEGCDNEEPESRGEFGELYGVPVGGVGAERRGALVIQVWGECGHTFVLKFQQHKGYTFVHTELAESHQ